MLLRASMTIAIAVLPLCSAAAQEPRALLDLPQLAPCSSTSHPRLPEKWQGTYLMAPFTKAQLMLAEIVSDVTLSAMRVKLHGVRRGSLDLFIAGNRTYLLKSEGSAIKECRTLGDTGWRPLPTDWLAPQSQCAGSAPIGETPVEWWKTAITPEPASYWLWFKTSDQSPFRLVFPFASDHLPPFSGYALSYQVRFNTVEETGLAEIDAVCRRSKPTMTGNPVRTLHAMIGNMSRSPQVAESEINRVMPELQADCPAVPFPEWPERLAITGLMTPFDSDESPYPAEVLYDWTVPAQRTRTFGGPEDGITSQDSLLLSPKGYTVTYYRDRPLVCRPVLPGAIRPDWAVRAPCECAATINGTTSLSPYGTARILVCPLASPRVAWAWYALSGKPTTFMVTSLRGDEGKRLFAVLDYRTWLPGQSFSRTVFDKPPQCAPASHSHPTRSPSRRCSTCHLGTEYLR
ncbi:hypothetical protein ACH79_32025 [Bradyrhizobium sp. CCBAU 051011]|uniref:hypothetical protein n=1 Tax=Bradyrhizobium sp. CCBAU 051011 TaxID=858422 RepID=UPI0013746DAA|nr:hypothetical protein [Bradyrhizobium sp. CCBAU 051011]QHO76562.1 hypothetical protein ACH79_32025 [Bradyrhizobium sp. CCBAU 051011]